MNPLERYQRVLEKTWAKLETLIPTIADDVRDYNSWITPAEAALVEAEAESEVHEPAGNGFSKDDVCRLFGVPPSMVVTEAESEVHEPRQNEQRSMTWHGWAVPAILEVLAEHWAPDFEDSIPGCGCAESTTRLDTEIDAAWRDHVAPLIADRIACDPQRAIEALSYEQRISAGYEKLARQQASEDRAEQKRRRSQRRMPS